MRFGGVGWETSDYLHFVGWDVAHHSAWAYDEALVEVGYVFWPVCYEGESWVFLEIVL